MKNIIIILLIFLFIYLNYHENFEVVSDIVYKNFEADYISNKKMKPTFIRELTMEKNPEIKCCLIEKKYLPSDNNLLYGGNFKYIFNKYENEKCDYKLHELNSNKMLFIEGDNDWSNNNCKDSLNKIGSCRNINKECIDFVSKDYCDKYKMVWSKETCHTMLPYIWKDRIKRVIPEKTTSGAFRMF
jgi:hypothetical protein